MPERLPSEMRWAEKERSWMLLSPTVPRPVSAQSFKAMAVGGLHSCALDLADRAWCWGFNGYGQLGDSTTNWTLNNMLDPSTGEPIGGTPEQFRSWLADERKKWGELVRRLG